MEQAVQVYQDAGGFSVEQQELLKEMLKSSVIKERPGQGGKKLKYVSGDYVIATANRIFGFGKWGYKVLSKSHEVVGSDEYYTADVELYVLGCPFPFPGEGIGVPQRATVEQHEKARKEAVTDALKRALRHFGDQFGLSLYNEDNFVEDESGNPVQVKDAGKNGNGHSQQPPRKTVVEGTVEHADSDLLTKTQLDSLRQLHGLLNIPDPGNLTTLRFGEAKTLIQQMKQEYAKASAGAGR